MAIAAMLLVSCGGGASNFDIKGTWKNTGEGTFGQMQRGAIVVFDGSRCNVYSPSDTYAFYSENGKYKLDVTGLLSGTVSFDVEVVDADHVKLDNATRSVELTRMSGEADLGAAASQTGGGDVDESDDAASQEAEDSGLGKHLTSEEQANGEFVLYQDGSLYTLCGCDTIDSYDEFDAYAKVYPADLIVISADDEGEQMPTYTAGDQVRYYSSSKVRDLQLVRVVPNGYATSIRREKTGISYIDADNPDKRHTIQKPRSEIAIADASGREYDPEDLCGLDKGEEITITWYEGTKYNEVTLTADYPCYVIDQSLDTELFDVDYGEFARPGATKGESDADDDEEDFDEDDIGDTIPVVDRDAIACIEGSLTKEGYAEYDISHVAPGVYCVNDDRLLEIA